MDWILVLAACLVVLGLLGTLLPILPGVPVIFAGMLLAAWAEQFSKVGGWVMALIGLIAAMTMVIDFFASYITTKKVGASKQAIWGMAIGAIFGLMMGSFGLFFGGVAIGALIGEFLAHQNINKATVVGLAAGLGFALGLVFKLVMAMLMLGIFAYAYYY